jgi:hypothetical protein
MARSLNAEDAEDAEDAKDARDAEAERNNRKPAFSSYILCVLRVLCV